ncbi:MAG TPA: hypothetical protein VMU34_24360 [Mycobacterium sp.]|nr:hypothetical protein [Mycobacterium sp.]
MADFSMVTNRVATGAAIATAADVDQLLAAGLNVVLDARADFNDGSLFAGNPHITYLWNPTEDDGTHKPVEYWQRTLAFVLPQLATPHTKAYLHCTAGLNRGPSNALCVLVAQGFHPDWAEAYIRQARPQVTIAYKADAIAACQALGFM